jgi:hypothetical protein
MSNLLNEVSEYLTDDVINQLSRQLGASDTNQVRSASMNVAELLLGAVTKNANNEQVGGGLMNAIQRDHDGGILGDIMGVLSGQTRVSNPKTTNGAGILNHLLGKKQLEAAQVVGESSGLDLFKSGVLMQLMAPIVMGVIGKKQRSGGLDIGGLASVLMSGMGNQSSKGGGAAGMFSKLLDMDGDGSAMDDLLNIGMKFLKK